MRLEILAEAGEDFQTHYHEWKDCIRCTIGTRAFKHVFARGTIPCDVLFVGEAPGDTENMTGFPFVGKSGRLLDKLIRAAAAKYVFPDPHPCSGMEAGDCEGFDGDKVFSVAITNTVLCRPCDDKNGPFREPHPSEKANCADRLAEFVRIASPKGIVFLGKHAAAAPTTLPVPMLALVHPSYILRNGGESSDMFASAVKMLAGFIGTLNLEGTI